MMQKSGIRLLGVVLGVVAVMVLMAAVAWTVFGDGGFSSLSSPVYQVRPWAEADFDAVMAPVASKVKGSDARFRPVVKSVARVPDEADETWMELEVVMRDDSEDWTAPYNVHVINAAGGFAYTDGERSGKATFVGARTNAPEFLEDSGGSGQLKLAFFTPGMEPLDEEGMKEAGVKPHDRTSWVQSEQPGTEIKIGVVVEGYEAVKWHLRGFYDRRTKVKVAGGGGWSSNGGQGRFSTNLDSLHDAEVRLVADFCHGPVERFTLKPEEGEVVEGDDFRVEIVGLVNGNSRGSGSSGGRGESTYHYRFDDVGGKETSAIFLITPKVGDDALTIDAIGKDGKVLRASGGGMSGFVRSTSWKGKPEEIDRFELVYRPNYERLLIDLPPLGGVPAENVGATNLFECVVPAGVIDREWELRGMICDATQLQLAGVSSGPSGAMKGFFPVDLGGLKVSEVVDLYGRQRPELSFRVDPVEMELEITEPGIKDWLERVKDVFSGWF